MTTDKIFSEIENISKSAVLKAGLIAKEYKNKISVKYKSKNQPVTEADTAIDDFFKSFFKRETPEFGWVSEESNDDKSRFSSEFFWCVDPIDGTRSYISGKPEYTISLALIKKNRPILGCIFNPETNEFFFAKKDRGAFCNDKKIYVNKNKDITSSIYAISNSEIKKLEQFNFFKKENIIKIGSIAYKIALVAKGKIDVALSFTKKNDWDLAASDLILREAGGNIKKMNGEDIIYNSNVMNVSSVIACNNELIQELCVKLND